MRDIARMERDFSKVDPKYFKYLPPDFKKQRLDKLKKAVITNQQVLNLVVREH
jgi:hypothetical protein